MGPLSALIPYLSFSTSQREWEYFARLSPIPDPVLPHYLRDPKSNDDPLLYYGFVCGMKYEGPDSFKYVPEFIEHIEKQLDPKIAELIEDTALHFAEARAIASKHIIKKIDQLLLNHAQNNRSDVGNVEVDDMKPDKKTYREKVAGRRVKVVAEYQAEAYTTRAIALCSNRQTHNVYELYKSEVVDEMCKIIKETLGLNQDATPQWYFASDRHGAK